MRILLVSQMYPGPDHPDLGPFVMQVKEELERQGRELALAVLERREGSRRKSARLALAAGAAARGLRPDVVYAHFLVPSGGIAAVAAAVSGARLVVTAHGRDVRNIGAIRGVASATRGTVRRAAAVIA